jgi:hypothetical protein
MFIFFWWERGEIDAVLEVFNFVVAGDLADYFL